MIDTPWRVLPHGELTQRTPNLWTVEGTLPAMPLTRTCAIARRADGDLVIHSAIAFNETTLAQVLALGRPKWMVVPSGFHRLDAPAWKTRFPDIQVVTPATTRDKVEEKVPVDFTLDEAGAHFGPDQGVILRNLGGTAGKEGVMETRQDGVVALVFNDALFNHPHTTGFKGFVVRMLGSTGGPKVTRIARTFIMSDRAALGQAFRELADTEGLAVVVPGHGLVMDDDPAAILRGVAGTL